MARITKVHRWSIRAAIDHFPRFPLHNKQMNEKSFSDVENLMKQLFHESALDTKW